MLEVLLELLGLSLMISQFIIVLGPLSREIMSRFPEELLYADDLGLVSETLGGQKGRLEVRKGASYPKWMRVSFKTKMMISRENTVKMSVGAVYVTKI